MPLTQGIPVFPYNHESKPPLVNLPFNLVSFSRRIGLIKSNLVSCNPPPMDSELELKIGLLITIHLWVLECLVLVRLASWCRYFSFKHVVCVQWWRLCFYCDQAVAYGVGFRRNLEHLWLPISRPWCNERIEEHVPFMILNTLEVSFENIMLLISQVEGGGWLP